MRLTAALGLAVALTCVPAFAEEGNVSQATLRALGLGGAEVLTDAQGLEVRGMASRARVGGSSVVFGQLVGRDGSIFIASDVNSSNARQRRNGGNSSFAAQGQGSVANGDLLINTRPRFDGIFVGNAFGGSFAIAGAP